METNKYTTALLGLTLLLLTACNNDENKISKDGRVDAARAIEFKVDFADYNESQNLNVTRTINLQGAEQKAKQIDLGNNVMAQCTITRDSAKISRKTITRTLPNDTYTMLAYDAITNIFKGEMTGTISGGVFTPADEKKRILLRPGKYNFVLFNSKVARHGNQLTVTRSDADAALLDRVEQTITNSPGKQQVTFQLKHVGVKVKLKLKGYMPFSGVTSKLASTSAAGVPGSSIYDAATGQWTTGADEVTSENLTYPNGQYRSGLYEATSHQEIMLMPGIDVSHLKLTFTTGSIYNANMANVSLNFHPSQALILEQNCTYVLTITLGYRFLYLMNNGDIGTIEDTPYGGSGGIKTPIAVVLSRSLHMAIALKDATYYGKTSMLWCHSDYYYTQVNTHSVIPVVKALTSDITSGYDETWDAGYTTSAVTGYQIKGTNPNFFPIYAAAKFQTGITYKGGTPLKYYLPSLNDYKWVYSTLCLEDPSTVTTVGNHPVAAASLADIAFTQVGGETISNKRYWTSTEVGWYGTGSIVLGLGFMNFSQMMKGNLEGYARAFIKY